DRRQHRGIAAVAQVDLLLRAHAADAHRQGHRKQAKHTCTDEKHGHPTASPRLAGIVWPYRHEQEGGLDRRRGRLVAEFLVESGDLATEGHAKRALVAFVEPRAFDAVTAELGG